METGRWLNVFACNITELNNGNTIINSHWVDADAAFSYSDSLPAALHIDWLTLNRKEISIHEQTRNVIGIT